MSGGVFLLRGGDLVAMRERPYDSEDVLQTLLERYPQLLGTDRDDAEGKWLLIRRELGVPGGESGGDRWSVDHLFVDRQAVPTLVEVKRNTDTRLRREVVGQMLDYAANGVLYWPADRLRSEFESRYAAQGLDPAAVLEEALGDGVDYEAFWSSVEQNLRSGRIRMVFVADVIPTELRRVIEFMNDQMSQANVVGLEVRQYVGEGDSKILVPQAVGQTEQARAQKPTQIAGESVSMTWDDYQRVLPQQSYEIARELFARIERYIEEHDLNWQPFLRRSYIGFQRSGGYGVVGVNLPRTKAVTFWVKLPASLADMQAAGLQVVDPYPNLQSRWDGGNRQTAWSIPALDRVPDVGPGSDLCRRFQPESGGMPSLAEIRTG